MFNRSVVGIETEQFLKGDLQIDISIKISELPKGHEQKICLLCNFASCFNIGLYIQTVKFCRVLVPLCLRWSWLSSTSRIAVNQSIFTKLFREKGGHTKIKHNIGLRGD